MVSPAVSARTLARIVAPSGRPTPGRDGSTYRGVAAAIRSAVLDGRIALGSRLPAERELAAALGTSRTTVSAAYGVLRDERWLRSRRGSGSVVDLPAPADGTGTPALYWGAPAGDTEDVLDLTVAALPAPLAPFREAVARATEQLPAYAATDGYHPLGLPSLRSAVAARYDAQGVPTRPEQVVVVSGAQHGFALVHDELTRTGERVVVECPTYPVALDLIRASGRVPAPVGLAVDGADAWDVGLLAATLTQSSAPLAYLQPDFQNPTGAVMSAEHRAAVVDAARRCGASVVVDETFRDVAFDGGVELPPPTAALDRAGRVLSVGSLSKAVWGGLRVGWIRTTPAIATRLGRSRALRDMAGPVLEQLVAVEVLAEPDPFLREQRARLYAGLQAVRGALAEHAPDWPATRPTGGASLWLRLPAPVATEAARLGPAYGVRFVPGPRFGPDGTMERYLRIPFTAPAETLRAAVPRVVAAVRAAAAPGTPPPRPADWVT